MKRVWAVIVVVCFSAWAWAEEALPRVTVRDGHFVEHSSGRPFAVRGFNYMRLRSHPENASVLWHGTFSRGRYDGGRAQKMLEDLAAHRFNVVRVFLDPLPDEGIIDAPDASALSRVYLENLFDFLQRARRQQIRVIVVPLSLPRCRRYIDLAGTIPPQLDGSNAVFLYDGSIRSKAQYMADVATAVRERDESLLSTIFAYEIDNESHYLAAAMPFSAKSGTITPADGTKYDLSSQEQKQTMADRHAVRMVDACVATLRKVDPEALVSASVFSFAAVGRTGPGKLHDDRSADPRFPVRPLVLMDSKVSYLSMHLYPTSDGALKRDLDSSEIPQVVPLARERGIPLIMGEFGVPKSMAATAREAASVAQRHLQQVQSAGLDAGWLYWTYDSDGQDLWTAKADEGAVFQMLAGHRAAP